MEGGVLEEREVSEEGVLGESGLGVRGYMMMMMTAIITDSQWTKSRV